MIVHEGVRFQCDECKFESTTSSHLKEHRKIKHEGNNAKCYRYLILLSNFNPIQVDVWFTQKSRGGGESPWDPPLYPFCDKNV